MNPNAAPVLLLFDIDLTLVRSGGSGLRAMHEALSLFTGRPGPFNTVRPDGKTDPFIVPELFAANGVAYDESRYEPFMQLYLARLEEEQRNATDWNLLPGVRELLDRLLETPGVYLALVTGNDERGARLKLAPFGLNRYFPVGGFASDSAIRHELIPIAMQRAERCYGQVFHRERTLVIGDAVGDVRCAAQAGVGCVAVTTGHATPDELRSTGPCHILEDLRDTDAVLALLCNPAAVTGS